MTVLAPRRTAQVRIEASLDLSGTLSYVGGKLLSEAGALRELYVQDIPPADYRIAELRKWVNAAFDALDEFEHAVRQEVGLPEPEGI